LVLLIAIGFTSLSTFRWWLLLRALHLNVPLLRTYFISWIGGLLSTVVPGTMGGDIVKGTYIFNALEDAGKAKILATLLVDRFVGVFGLTVLAITNIMWNFSLVMSQTKVQTIAIIIICLFIIMTLFLTVIVIPINEVHDPFLFLINKLPGKSIMAKCYKAIKLYQFKKKVLLLTVLTSIMIQVLLIYIFWQLTQLILIPKVSIYSLFFIIPVGTITTIVPLAPGGIGVGHIAFEYLYNLFGVRGGADIFNSYIILQIGVNTMGGIPYMIYPLFWKKPDQNDGKP